LALCLVRALPRLRIPAGEHGVFNALMILRFVRDDGMTWRCGKVPRK
jgi:hypothetical protein